MISERSNEPGEPGDDSEWAWVGDAYRDTPAARPEAIARAVRAAEATVTARRAGRAPLRWALGAAAVIGLVLLGPSLADVLRRGTPVSSPAAAGRGGVRFALVAPSSARVALVGDFNDWDLGATPLAPTGRGTWAVTVPLEPGRYRYTFVVDGRRWIADPAEPAAPDEFGRPTSVITVASQ